MKKSFIAPLGLALLCAAPLSAQQMSQDELIQWATDRGTCGENAVVGAKYLDDGRVQVTCGRAGTRSAAAGGGALAGGLAAGGGGTLAAVVGVVVVAAAAGAANSSSGTN